MRPQGQFEAIMLDIHLSTFEVDATPPLGHPLCGGWIKPVEGVDDRLKMRGILLEGSGLPVVLASLDWTGVSNDSHRIWTEALAAVAMTTPDRVALHCVHQHNAPFVDHHGNLLLQKSNAATLLFDPLFFDSLVESSCAALRAAMSDGRPIDRIRVGQAEVRQVASNRRIIAPNGKLQFTRYSSTTDPIARAAPEGTIDPMLRSLTFCLGDRPKARLYYYTTHPMSYYGDGRVSADFVGLARTSQDAEEPDVFHVYFTGCAGNITAGKYNDGQRSNRTFLADRVAAAMARADDTAIPHDLTEIEWRSHAFNFKSREDLDYERLAAIVADPAESTVNRNRSAMTCGWLARNRDRRPITLGLLDLGSASVLHLPAEPFVEYQLEAQSLDPSKWLGVAAYGDGGPWYIPLERSYAEGGYEPSVSWVSAQTEPDYRAAITSLLRND
jgi:hypothetical protein